MQRVNRKMVVERPAPQESLDGVRFKRWGKPWPNPVKGAPRVHTRGAQIESLDLCLQLRTDIARAWWQLHAPHDKDRSEGDTHTHTQRWHARPLVVHLTGRNKSVAAPRSCDSDVSHLLQCVEGTLTTQAGVGSPVRQAVTAGGEGRQDRTQPGSRPSRTRSSTAPRGCPRAPVPAANGG